MSLLEYYELKEKYEDDLARKKKRIKNNDYLSMKEKRAEFKKIIPKCVNCKKPGGTIFEEKNGLFKAACGSKTPCDLNLSVKRQLYDNVRDLEQRNFHKIDNLKMRIIMVKLDYLFGFFTNSEEVIERFNALKNELTEVSETQLLNQKKYYDIISGIHREPILLEAEQQLLIEVQSLKQLYQEYEADPERPTGYLTTMAEKYIRDIKPLVNKIREMKYSHYTLELDDDKIIQRLIAEPYLHSQLEQERK
jgi:hypothetical protein